MMYVPHASFPGIQESSYVICQDLTPIPLRLPAHVKLVAEAPDKFVQRSRFGLDHNIGIIGCPRYAMHVARKGARNHVIDSTTFQFVKNEL